MFAQLYERFRSAGRRFLSDLRRSARNAGSHSRPSCANSSIRVRRCAIQNIRSLRLLGRRSHPKPWCSTANWKIAYRGRIDNWYSELGKSRSAATTHDLADAIEATLAGRPVAEPVTKAVGCYIEDLK